MRNPTIYAVGYGNRDWDTFLNLLQEYAITMLVDIRTLPFSRFNPAFRQAALERGLQEADIEYKFMGDELGGKPKDASLYTNGKLNYDLVEVSPAYKEGILKLLELEKQGGRICIMCSELKPDNCHRKNLVGRTLVRMDVTINHIDEKGKIQVQENENEGRLF